MKPLRLFLFVHLMFFALACDFLNPDADEDDISFGPNYDCSYTAKSVYDVGTDVTQDFNVSGGTHSVEILTTDCYELTEGDVKSQTYNNLVRSGSSITLYDGSGEGDSLGVSGDNTLAYSESGSMCSGGLYLTISFTGGNLDTSNDLVVLYFEGKIDREYCLMNSRATSKPEAPKSILSNLRVLFK